VARQVWVTGYGLLSPLGETSDAWWPLLNDPAACAARIDRESFAPFPVYPIGEYDIAQQIPRPGDQRAMGPLMHYGCYAAGVALDAAGIKGDEELLLHTHRLAAAGGGERDTALDRQILDGLETAPDKGVYLNTQLSNELRPTLFLAQLPNLFAGNISIVHGVAGSSRTFMGEEPAGLDAVRIAHERILSNQGDLFLVGAAFNATRHEIIHIAHAGGYLLAGEVGNLWDRAKDGIAPGSAGAFMVLEASDHATARGVKPSARLVDIVNGLSPRTPGAAASEAQEQWRRIEPQLGQGGLAVMSGACGSGPITAEEHGMLEAIAGSGRPCAVRGLARATGHAYEASFVANAIYGLACLERGEVFAPLSPEDALEARVERAEVDQVLVTGWGFAQGEGMALLERIDG
jgi:3-oxoacyl-[acyl-carrier-protein] synthase II